MSWQQIASIVVALISWGMAYWQGIQHGRRLELLDVSRYSGGDNYRMDFRVAVFVLHLLEGKHRHG